MHNEFCCQEDVTFEGPYQTGQDVLDAFEIGDVNREHDMLVLAGYGLIIHLVSFVVLYLRYNAFHGKLVRPKCQIPRQAEAATIPEQAAAAVDASLETISQMSFVA